jgi:hypothetical protein
MKNIIKQTGYYIFKFGDIKLKIDSDNNIYLMDKNKPGIWLHVTYENIGIYMNEIKVLNTNINNAVKINFY